MMTKIYSQAQHVYIWLGREIPGDHQAVQLCVKLCDVFALKVSDSSVANRSKLEDADLPLAGLPGKDSTYWTNLRSFFRKPWFSRAWVVQECIVAKSSDMLCGQLCVCPNLVFLAAEAYKMNLHHIWSSNEDSQILYASSFQGLRKQLWRCNHTTLFNVAFMARGQSASVNKDKLFSYYGLTHDLPQSFVDYNKQFSELLLEVMMQELKRSNSLRSVSLVHHCRRLKGLPSWALDFTHSDLYNDLRMFDDLHIHPISASYPPKFNITDQGVSSGKPNCYSDSLLTCP